MICKDELRCNRKGVSCKMCKHNPNAELQDFFSDRGYISACKHGYDDCISDPALMLYEYDTCSWTRENYSIEELKQKVRRGCCCDNGELYEDK